MKIKFSFLPLIVLSLSACQSLDGLPVGEDGAASAASGSSPTAPTAPSSPRAPTPPTAPGETVSFRDAALLALHSNPGLKPFNPELRAADGRILQAFLKPNPILNGEIENIAGSGAFNGIDAAESTLQLSQLIERGGKRHARRDVEMAQKALVFSDYEIARREVFTEVARAFAEALAAQERIALLQELVELNESFVPAIEKRIKAGKVTVVERTRAQTAITSARLAKLQAQRKFRVAKLRLAATWGSTKAGFQSVSGRLGPLPSEASQAALEKRLFAHPAYRKDEKAVSKSEADYRLALANGVQDVTFRGGLRHFWVNNDDVALVVGVSFPLPVHNRNQGEIAATEAEIEAALLRREATMVSLKARLSAAIQTLRSIRQEVATISKELLPGAEAAFSGVEEGYRKGRFGYLDLIDASRSLTEAQVQLLTAKAAYQVAAADISGLTAPLPSSE